MPAIHPWILVATLLQSKDCLGIICPQTHVLCHSIVRDAKVCSDLPPVSGQASPQDPQLLNPPPSPPSVIPNTLKLVSDMRLDKTHVSEADVLVLLL